MSISNFYFYVFFAVIVVCSIIIDTLLQKNELSIKKAVQQFIIWVFIAGVFGVILLFFKNKETFLKFTGGYITELSLSIDNIFVFILIFKQYKIKAQHGQKLLLIGILLAIVLRIIFIALGIELIDRFAWILYLFGPILIYTGIKIMKEKEEIKEIKENKFIVFIKNHLRYSAHEHHGKYFININHKTYLSSLTLVATILALTDIIFAIDSIPTIISLVKTNPKIPFSSDEILVVYSSNIFAVLGLRALFTILQNMSQKFEYLSKAIGGILIFIGLKMLITFFNIHISTHISLLVIIVFLGLGIFLSKFKPKKL